MKRMLFLLIGFCLSIVVSTNLYAQTTDTQTEQGKASAKPAKNKKQTKAEREAAMMDVIRQKVYSKDFKVKIVQATPLRTAARKLDPGYSFQVKGDSVFCDMPYIGDTAMNMSYTGSQGMSFNEKLKSYSTVQLDQNHYTAFLTVSNKEDNYNIQVDLYNNGVVNIAVTPVRRDAISYGGLLDLPKPSKK
ncbi:MAG: DUF4251 domain-containing protein [Alloprevotella sp.]|nr:DUF4251 domain-containing protein [Alloprevotella sp.]